VSDSGPILYMRQAQLTGTSANLSPSLTFTGPSPRHLLRVTCMCLRGQPSGGEAVNGLSLYFRDDDASPQDWPIAGSFGPAAVANALATAGWDGEVFVRTGWTMFGTVNFSAAVQTKTAVLVVCGLILPPGRLLY
jgi:hypothetical protein